MNLTSYTGREFVVISNDARLRQERDLSKFVKYAAEDELPPGKKIGDARIIPKRARVRVLGIRTDTAKNAFALVAPTAAGAEPFGWTMATNLEGGMLNETAGVAPDSWACAPCGDNFTVTDSRALVRTGPPGFASTGATLAPGSFVVVTARSDDGRHVRVSRARIDGGSVDAEDDLGWTALANLTDGCSDVFGTPAWADTFGPNACWEKGRCIGQKVLVQIVGTGGEMEQVTLDTLGRYMELRDAAANDGVQLGIESGFRTFAKQKDLHDGFVQGKPGFNLAAAPGRSNHQNGRAFDLNTRGFDGDPVYDWLKRNAPAHGFIRTVNREHWHWEYRPAEAATLRERGRFATAGVRK